MNHWSSFPNLPAGDPRLVYVLLTDYGVVHRQRQRGLPRPQVRRLLHHRLAGQRRLRQPLPGPRRRQRRRRRGRRALHQLRPASQRRGRQRRAVRPRGAQPLRAGPYPIGATTMELASKSHPRGGMSSKTKSLIVAGIAAVVAARPGLRGPARRAQQRRRSRHDLGRRRTPADPEGQLGRHDRGRPGVPRH